jgi:hypothetical protein
MSEASILKTSRSEVARPRKTRCARRGEDRGAGTSPRSPFALQGRLGRRQTPSSAARYHA